MVADVGGKRALAFGTAKKRPDLETATAGEGNVRGDVGGGVWARAELMVIQSTAQITPTVRTLAYMGLVI
jgi:hypothetical protein